MRTPDARPGTEGAGETAERGIICAYCGDYATYATTDEAALEAARQTMIAHDAVCPRNPLVAHIRELESAAEARAALLASLRQFAPTVWVRMDEGWPNLTRLYDTDPRTWRQSFTQPNLVLETPPIISPGTVRRYVLVPIEEEGT